MTTTPSLGDSLFGQPQELYGVVPGASASIDIADINQDQWGDCYLDADMIAMVHKGPSFISNMIHQNANGTQTVKLYEDAKTGAPVTWATTSFKAVSEVVSDNFTPGSTDWEPSQDLTASGLKVIWPQVIEQAYAQLMGGIGNIDNGGDPGLAMEALTGQKTYQVQPTTFNINELSRLINENCTITFTTPPSFATAGLTNGLLPDHCYTYTGCEGWETAGGANTTLNLANPWGNTQPTPVAISNVSRDFSMIDIGHA